MKCIPSCLSLRNISNLFHKILYKINTEKHNFPTSYKWICPSMEDIYASIIVNIHYHRINEEAYAYDMINWTDPFVLGLSGIFLDTLIFVPFIKTLLTWHYIAAFNILSYWALLHLYLNVIIHKYLKLIWNFIIALKRSSIWFYLQHIKIDISQYLIANNYCYYLQCTYTKHNSIFLCRILSRILK